MTLSNSPRTTPANTGRRHGRRARPAVLVVFAAIAAIAALVLPAQAAHAANYTYWGYYQVVAGKWSFYQVGPDKSAPKDGAVEGWRWAVDDGTGKTPRTPRALPSFTDVCAATAVATGKKRVAVVIDYGRGADGDGSTAPPAPLARCASVATTATGSEVLAAVADVRTAKGLVCGLNGYPASGCGGEVATLTDAQKAADTPVSITAVAVAGPTPSETAAPGAAIVPSSSGGSSGIPIGVWVGIVVVLLGAIALVLSARRRARTE